MPRLNPAYQSTVFFLMAKGGKTPVGSGVMIGVEGSSRLVLHRYAVTALHATKSAYSIRVNTMDGKSRNIPIDPIQWRALHGVEDLAAIEINELVRDDDEIAYIPPEAFITKEFIKDVELGIGEDGFMLGLFTGQRGRTKNLVAARFGNVSLLADEAEPIKQKETGITSPCHIFDMRSRPGFSGSAVYVYRTPTADLRDIEGKAKRDREREKAVGRSGALGANVTGTLTISAPTELSQHHDWLLDLDAKNNAFVMLLGIHVGQFQEHITVNKIKKPKPARKESEYDIKDGDTIGFPGSMTIVVPAWQILLLLTEDKELIRLRQAREDKFRKMEQEDGGAFVSESETAIQAAPETDNPSHKEDFRSLLGAAARSNKPAS